MRPEFDETDQKLLDARIEVWNKRQGPRVGDYILLIDGTLRRFTHDWGDSIQTTTPGDKFGSSFYFAGDYMSFSGGLDPAIPKTQIKATNQTNGVSFMVPCRVYRQTEGK